MTNEYSFSRVEKFKICPYAYYLRYVAKIPVEKDIPAANDPCVVGTALHHGLEVGTEKAIEEYKNNFFIASDGMIDEITKLNTTIPKVQKALDDLVKDCEITYEYKLTSEDGFVGFIDCLIKYHDGTYGIYDFKYSNQQEKYKASAQVHLYKYFFEKMNPGATVSKIGYIMADKVGIRQKKTETIWQFRSRLEQALDNSKVTVIDVEYDDDKVKQFFTDLDKTIKATEFPKSPSFICNWCEHFGCCQLGENIEMLPKSNARRQVEAYNHKKIWIYGAPFIGKTTLADQFPDPIFLSTDGNINSFTAPYVQIKDVYDGPIMVKSGWALFEETVDDLAKGGHQFKTVVVDLCEDTYEFCRQWAYKKLNITHESNDAFNAWDIVRSNFFRVYRKLSNLPMNIVIISHEDKSKDITNKGGEKKILISPALSEKVCNKIAGMVDLVAHITMENGRRVINLKTSDTEFGGGRLKIAVNQVPCSFEALTEIYSNQKALANK